MTETKEPQLERSAHNGKLKPGQLLPPIEVGKPIIKYIAGIRYVSPHFLTMSTFPKHRMYLKTLLDVYTSEFPAHSRDYYREAIEAGNITIHGGHKVSPDYVIQGFERLENRTHRHEPPVLCPSGGLELIIPKNDLVFVVNKPPSMPVHPCGRYNFNSVIKILDEMRDNGDSRISQKHYLVHRIDRLTSGLLLVAPTAEKADKMRQKMEQKKTIKVYLARVKGRLEQPLAVCVPIGVADMKQGVRIPDLDAQPENEPLTRPIPSTLEEEEARIRTILQILKAEEKIKKQFSKEKQKHIATEEVIADMAARGKFSETWITPLAYDEVTDCTLVACRILTGRSHQIRVHLKWLGHPIIDDVSYGGDHSMAYTPFLHAITESESPWWPFEKAGEAYDENCVACKALEKNGILVCEDDVFVVKKDAYGGAHIVAGDSDLPRSAFSSISLHSFFYIIDGETISVSLPPWVEPFNVEKESLIEKIKKALINSE